MTPWVIYVQVDQYLGTTLTDEHIRQMIALLEASPDKFHIDLAGNQGQGRFSERAFFVNRARYLAVPGMDTCIGGPGPYADHKWTEQLVQEHMAVNNLGFISPAGPPAFIDNGKWSRRTYPDGAETLHSTDEKRLFVIRSFKERLIGFPNLKLNDTEWDMAINGTWPSGGMIPEADRPHSFVYWRE